MTADNSYFFYQTLVLKQRISFEVNSITNFKVLKDYFKFLEISVMF